MIWLWLPLALLLALWLWPQAFSRAVAGRIDGCVTASRREMHPGDEAKLQVTLVNRSFAPIPLAELEIELPHQLSFSRDRSIRLGHVTLAVLPRRQAEIELNVYAVRRGPAAPLKVRAAVNEGLGLAETYVQLEDRTSFAVRPRRVPAKRMLLVTPAGFMTRESRLFPDETSLRGVRPYTAFDPVRHIHWRASARLGELVVKEFFATEAPDWAVVLNAQATRPHWMGGLHPDVFDALCEQSLAIAQALSQAGGRLFFATNAACQSRQRATMAWLAPDGVASLLAHAQPVATCDLEALVTAMARSPAAPRRAVILSAMDEHQEGAWWRRLGMDVTWIRVGASSEGLAQETRGEAVMHAQG
ncbi:DUF58 domain-containing protein [Alicyclobacillus vulcanalis]|uniref:Uncharacterized conserved protein, DUF58 family, contains vWF domain n=1 Tax=Alicyclobacillus vulcanalis TaxID=252246 RepID=A0A1N7PB08_9BACL|nr:DUF58 domain-containing protein [Alicyclobacillus vulcanalis]SIT07697.1 Uncharacterized conserved protein, DUF58 family, contains vWF domain [Alicyclobacillus vulcanalis]